MDIEIWDGGLQEQEIEAINKIKAAFADTLPAGIIEAGLVDSKLSFERAAQMASFCEWASEQSPVDLEEQKLLEAITTGLQRLKIVLSGSALAQTEKSSALELSDTIE